MSFTLHKYLQVKVVFIWVLGWNTILGTGIWLGHKGLESSEEFTASFAFASLLTSIFCLSLLVYQSVRKFSLRPGVQLDSVSRDLWFLVMLSGIIGLAAVFSLFQ